MTFIGLAIIVAVWGLYVLASVGVIEDQTNEDLVFLLYMAIIGTPIGAAIMLLRIRWFIGFFKRGVVVSGSVVDVYWHKDRGRIEYTYTYQSKDYRHGNGMMKTRMTARISVGDEVKLIVDPQNPKRALIRNLYWSK